MVKEMTDITGAEIVEVTINHSGEILWVNTEKGCVLRICRIKKLIVTDNRPKRRK